MTIAIVAVFAAAAASAGPVLAPSRALIPLPGYAATGAELPTETRSAARAGESAFPSTDRLFGDTPDPLDSLAVGDDDLRDSVASPPSAATLQAGLRSNRESARIDAVRASARPRGVEAVPHLAGAMLRLDQPVQVRAAAALALGRIGDGIAVKALAEALRDPSPEVRYSAALSLGRMPADGVATRLEHVLRSDPAWQPRYAAAIALGRMRKPFAAFPLADALSSDPAWQVRQQAARSLQDLGTDHALAALAVGLHDPEASVRAAAGSALAESGGPVERRAVADALRTEPDPSVRAMLTAATRRALLR
jgi:HEAT repeat protein